MADHAHTTETQRFPSPGRRKLFLGAAVLLAAPLALAATEHPPPGTPVTALALKLAQLWRTHDSRIDGHEEVFREIEATEDAVLVATPTTVADAIVILGVAATRISVGLDCDNFEYFIKPGEQAVRRVAKFLGADRLGDAFAMDTYMPDRLLLAPGDVA